MRLASSGSWSRARAFLALVGGVLVGAAIFVFLVVADADFVAESYEESPTATLPAVVAAAAAAVGTVVGVVWYRRRVDCLGRRSRRALGWFGIAWSVLFVIAFWWTHPMSRDAGDADPLQAAVVTYVLLIIVAALAFFPIAVLRLSRRKPHAPDDQIRVWRVKDKQPYFVAYCDCGWVGDAHDADGPRAQDSAFRDARRHGTNVAPEVEHPLG
jgi:hypothetical protein